MDSRHEVKSWKELGGRSNIASVLCTWIQDTRPEGKPWMASELEGDMLAFPQSSSGVDVGYLVYFSW